MKYLAGLVCLTFLAAGVVRPANAEDYPTRQIEIVVPYTPGGALDTLARTVGRAMEEELHQSVVILNKPGGATITGNVYVAHAAKDGYTLLFAGAPLALNVALGMTTPYDPFKDLTPISLVATNPILFAVNPSSPYKTLADLVSAAKSDPEGISYSSAGVGSSPHLVGEALKQKANANLVHVPFKGSAPAMTAVMGNDVQFIVDAFIPTGTAVLQGQLRAVAVASKQRMSFFPDVPTTAEAGYPDVVGETYFGMLAPAGTPPQIVQLLHDTIAKVCAKDAVRKSLEKLGYTVIASTPAEYTAYLHHEIDRWTPIVKAAGIKVE